MTARSVLLAPVLLLATLAAGCFGFVGLAHLSAEHRLAERAAGVPLHAQLSLHAGPAALSFARNHADDDEAREFLRGMDGADILVLNTDDGPADAYRKAAAALAARPGWSTIARVHDGGDDAAVLVRLDGERVRELRLVARDGEDLVLAHVEGDLDRAIAAAAADKLARDHGSIVASIQ